MLILFTMANLAGTDKLWGLNFLKFYDKSPTIIALITCLIFFHFNFSRKTVNTINELGRRLAENKEHRLTAFVLGAVAVIVIFLLFSSSTTLLGDGSLRVNQVEGTRWWLASEPLDFFLHALVYRFIFQPLGLDAESCYRWISALSGILFLHGAYRLSIYLNPKKWLLNLLFIISSGVLVQFFGYIESYSVAAALLPLVFLSGLKTVDGSGSKTVLLILFVIAGFFHPVAAFIFSLGVAFAVLMTGTETDSKVTRVSRILTVMTATFLVISYAARFARLDNLERFLLSFLPESETAQAILTLNHWLNILNWIFIAALPALVLAPALLKSPGNTDPKSKVRMHYAFWCSVPPLLFLFFFTPQLGGPRDWDLFSLPAFTVMLSVLTAYHSRRTAGLPHQILPALAISFWIVIGFAGVNSSITKAADRQEEIIETSRFRNLYNEYANLHIHAVTENRLHDRRYHYALKAWQEPPYTKSDSVYILNHLAKLALERNDSASSINSLELSLNTDTSNVYSHLLLLNYLNQFETREKVFEGAQLVAARFPDKLLALCALGTLYCQADSIDRAAVIYAKAYQLDSSRLDINLNYGAILYQLNNTEMGLNLLRRANQISRENFLVYFHLSSAHHQTGRMDSASHYYEKARPLAKSRDELRLLYQLQVIISNLPNRKDGEGKTTH